jgi:hypothetical protein
VIGGRQFGYIQGNREHAGVRKKKKKKKRRQQQQVELGV